MVEVSIDGETTEVRNTMTVAAALVAAGKLYTGRALSGGPRFALCGMGVCQECRVMVDGREHSLACQVVCRSGMMISTGGAART
jgi:hypothetical protein